MSSVLRRLFVLLVLAAAVTVFAAGCGGSSNSGGSGGGSSGRGPAPRLGPVFPDIGSLPGAEKTPPPWAPAPKLVPRLKAIGLPALRQEALTYHIHQHLDLFVNGQRVAVPPDVGIDPAAGIITVLHTHDSSGYIHVESPTVASYSLGQFFAVWGVPLSKSCIGSLCTSGGKVLRAWVNGNPVAADPSRIVLDAHQEIVVAYGTPAQMPKNVPSTYDFSPVG
jgi:hypothetical protein